MQFQGRDEQATGVAAGVGGRVTCSWGGGLLLMEGFCGVQAHLGEPGQRRWGEARRMARSPEASGEQGWPHLAGDWPGGGFSFARFSLKQRPALQKIKKENLLKHHMSTGL